MIWQTITATLIVVAAAAWLCRRVYRIVTSGSRDGEGHVTGCGTCSNNPQAASTSPLIQLNGSTIQTPTATNEPGSPDAEPSRQ